MAIVEPGAEIDPRALIVLANAIPTKQATAAKKQIAEGSQCSIHLTAAIERLVRGLATPVAPTVSLLSKQMIAELLRRLGVTREAFKRELLQLATEALVEQRKVGRSLTNAHPELLLALDDIEQQILAKLPKPKRAGAIQVQASTQITDVVIGS